MTSSWLELAIPYFVPACRDVFDAYFARHGFGLSRADFVGRVAYSNGRCFVEISYWLEDAPLFAPMVSIGIDPRYLPESMSGFNRVGLWCAMPDGVEASHYSRWRFESEKELRATLSRIRFEVIDEYAKPLWLHPERLSSLIERRHGQVTAPRGEATSVTQRSEAVRALRAGNYEQVLDIYRAIGVENLTPIDQKRFEIAVRLMLPGAP